jgi:hypothetical protein
VNGAAGVDEPSALTSLPRFVSSRPASTAADDQKCPQGATNDLFASQTAKQHRSPQSSALPASVETSRFDFDVIFHWRFPARLA